MPKTPMAMAAQTCAPQRFLNRIRFKTGTMRIYSAVMKPALPAVVVTMPYC